MTVRKILDEKGGSIFSMPSTASVGEVCAELASRRVGAVVIVDGDELKGILSERDVVTSLARHGAAALERRAADIMTRHVETCVPEDRIAEVMQRMTRGRFRHFPVVAEGRMVGLISIGDVVKQRIAEAEREAAAIREYITTA